MCARAPGASNALRAATAPRLTELERQSFVLRRPGERTAADGVGRVPRSRVDVALQLRPDDASIRDDAFISVDALEEVDEDPLLDGDAFRAHVRANRERLSRTWSVV